MLQCTTVRNSNSAATKSAELNKALAESWAAPPVSAGPGCRPLTVTSARLARPSSGHFGRDSRRARSQPQRPSD
jgi:hypothetical protein